MIIFIKRELINAVEVAYHISTLVDVSGMCETKRKDATPKDAYPE